MPELKIATFNLEWMIAIFGAPKKGAWNGKIPSTFPGTKRGPISLPSIDDVPALCRRIAGVIRDMGVQILGFQEGPPEPKMMKKFVHDYLNDEYTVHLSNYNNQTVGALVHTSIADRVQAFAPNDPEVAALSKAVPYYPWVAFREKERKTHKFNRIPLVLKCSLSADVELRLVVVHTKSKFSKLKTRKQWDQRDEVAVLDALDSRQKISAEVATLRRFLDEQLTASSQPRPIIVMGDFNDGPFQDLMEEEFLIQNILDELVGSFLWPAYYFQHAMDPAILERAKTVRFPNPLQGGEMTDELLDHILVSPAIWQHKTPFQVKPGTCQVEETVYDAHTDASHADEDRGARPSDHRPVSVVLEY